MLQIPEVVVGDITLQPLYRRVRIASDSVKLTEQESYLLEALALCEGTMVTRRMLVSVLQLQYRKTIEPNNINAHIHRLRKKLRNSLRVTIDTINRCGYKLCVSP